MFPGLPYQSDRFTVVTPAESTALLTIDELRALAGVADGSRDAILVPLGAALSIDIPVACGVREDGVNPPTLLAERLEQTFRLQGRAVDRLVLARRFVSDVAVVENGTTLTADVDFEVDASQGTIRRLADGHAAFFALGVVVVTLTSGFAEVPDDLKGAAIDLARLRYVRATQDPTIRSEDVTGVGSTTYWIAGAADPSIPAAILERLGRFQSGDGLL